MYYDPIRITKIGKLLPHRDAADLGGERLVPLVSRGHWDTSGPRIPTDPTIILAFAFDPDPARYDER